MNAAQGHVVVIGASSGGIGALLQLSQSLPKFFKAPVCIVQHVGAHPSLLPELLRFRGANHAMHAEDGQRLTAGTLHIAPPDHHMLLDGDRIRLTRGPKENHARPAIDPLFRTAALDWGPRAIGVILTGQLDDGSSGLKAIEDCGGTTVVQDPASATEPSMPRNALAVVKVDHCVPLDDIAPLLVRLVAAGPEHPRRSISATLQREVAINREGITMDDLSAIATPSTLTCPDCGGSLWEVKDKPLRYRCHTGHAYTALTLAAAQQDVAEEALWSTARALHERELLLRRLADIAIATGDDAQAAAGVAEADRVRDRLRRVTAMAERATAGLGDDTDA